MNYLSQETLEVFFYLLFNKENLQSKDFEKIVSVYDKNDELCELKEAKSIYDDIERNNLEDLFTYEKTKRTLQFFIKLNDRKGLIQFLKEYTTKFINNELEREPRNYYIFEEQLNWGNKILNYYSNEGEKSTIVINSDYQSFPNAKIQIPCKVRFLEILLFLYFHKNQYIDIVDCKDTKEECVSNWLTVDIHVILSKSPDEIKQELSNKYLIERVAHHPFKVKITYIETGQFKEIRRVKTATVFEILFKHYNNSEVEINEFFLKCPIKSKTMNPEKTLKKYLNDINGMLVEIHGLNGRHQFIKIRNNKIIEVKIP